MSTFKINRPLFSKRLHDVAFILREQNKRRLEFIEDNTASAPPSFFGNDTFAYYNADFVGIGGNQSTTSGEDLLQYTAVDIAQNPIGLDLEQPSQSSMFFIEKESNGGNVFVSRDGSGSRFLKSAVLGTGILHRDFTVIVNYYKMTQTANTAENVLRLTDADQADAMRYESQVSGVNDRQNALDSANTQHTNDVENTEAMTGAETIIFSFLQDLAGGQVSLRSFANDGTITTQSSANGFKPLFDSITLGADTGDKAIAIKVVEVIDRNVTTAEATAARDYYNNLYGDWYFYDPDVTFGGIDVTYNGEQVTYNP